MSSRGGGVKTGRRMMGAAGRVALPVGPGTRAGSVGAFLTPGRRGDWLTEARRAFKVEDHKMMSIEPAELVRDAGRTSELVFAHENGRSPWLLVRLEGADDELVAGLRVTGPLPAARQAGQIAFRTEAISIGAIRAARSSSRSGEVDLADILRSLGDGKYHATPIQKRTDVDAVFGERISLGRAMNKDLVFRHASISKFHAYFELSDGGMCRVADAGSKNGVVVNGTKIAPKSLVEVNVGDAVTFGAVWTMVLDARTLWRLLRHR
jgi:hypothetical protein